ncbi:MAG: PEGA domain-containing protein [Melioribacteraceae bacterium]|jgi:hypothetical protein|nr:PEGA domain-containing protein [Melioribacteraceae bacterium]
MKLFLGGIIITIFLLFFSCREDIVEFSELNLTGNIYIDSSPRGAEIFLNNYRIGKSTPDSLVNIQAGSYSLKLRLIGYEDSIVIINIHPNEKRYINISFRYY